MEIKKGLSDLFLKRQAIKRFSEEKPKIAILSDIDHSLIPWKEGKYRVEVHEDILAENFAAIHEIHSINALVTGIDLLAVKLMEKHFRDSPVIDFLSTDNGKGGLYINNEGIQTQGWVDLLKLKAQDTDWSHFVKEIGGWNQELFVQIVQGLLNKAGFTKEANNKLQIVYPNYEFYELLATDKRLSIVLGALESALYSMKTKETNHDFAKDSANEIAKSIISEYENRTGVKLKFNYSEHDDYFYFFFKSDNGIEIEKSTASKLILESLPTEITKDLKAAISIGDSKNDTHLKLLEIQLQENKIPVYDIFSGTDLLDNPEFCSHPRIEVAEEMGNIGAALRKVIQRIYTET